MSIIDKLAALEKAATLGPWVANPYGASGTGHGSIGRPYQSSDRGDCEVDKVAECCDIDAEFIVAVRNALPALLAVCRAADNVASNYDDNSSEELVDAVYALRALDGAGGAK